MAFGNEEDFKYLQILDDNSNNKIFGDDNDFKVVLAQNVETFTPFGNINDFQSIIANDTQISNSNKSNNVNFGEQTTGITQNNLPFGNEASFISTVNITTAPMPFGNDDDFIYLSTDISYDAQELLALYHEQQVQSAGFSQRDCGRIDIGNMYASYEIQRPCDRGHQLYSRFCPCDKGDKGGCNHRPTLHHSSTCKPNKPEACKLSRKIYQQIMFASSKVAFLITCAPCQHIANELVDIKKTLDTLSISMLAITREICHSEPIFMHGNENEDNDFYEGIDNVIKLLSIIIQNILHLQKMPESKCVENALVLLAFGIITQQNRLIALCR